MVRLIDPGKLNVYFRLEQLTTQDDGAGGTDQPEWNEVAEFWGELIQNSRNIGMRETEMNFAYSYKINTYWMPELDYGLYRMRVVSDSGKTLYIDNIENVEEKNMYVVIYCSYEK